MNFLGNSQKHFFQKGHYEILLVNPGAGAASALYAHVSLTHVTLQCLFNQNYLLLLTLLCLDLLLDQVE